MPASAAASAAGRPCCCSSGGCCGPDEDDFAGAEVVVAPAGLSIGPDAVVLPTLLTDGSCSSGVMASDVTAGELRCSNSGAAPPVLVDWATDKEDASAMALEGGAAAAAVMAAAGGKAMAGTAAAAAAAAALDSSEELCRRRLAAEGERGDPPGGGLGDSGGLSADGGTAVPDACKHRRQQVWSESGW